MTHSANELQHDAANNLTIIFGVLAAILAFTAIVLGICQYRRMPSSKRERSPAADFEMQPIRTSSCTNGPTTPLAAVTAAAAGHTAPAKLPDTPTTPLPPPSTSGPDSTSLFHTASKQQKDWAPDHSDLVARTSGQKKDSNMVASKISVAKTPLA
ncbi:hypothetical protein LTS10_006431 [Elasticomyces elasticus]|nr:hypothetical protein LTS10_006431 [Elasticomyces elasticus]